MCWFDHASAEVSLAVVHVDDHGGQVLSFVVDGLFELLEMAVSVELFRLARITVGWFCDGHFVLCGRVCESFCPEILGLAEDGLEPKAQRSKPGFERFHVLRIFVASQKQLVHGSFFDPVHSIAVVDVSSDVGDDFVDDCARDSGIFHDVLVNQRGQPQGRVQCLALFVPTSPACCHVSWASLMRVCEQDARPHVGVAAEVDLDCQLAVDFDFVPVVLLGAVPLAVQAPLLGTVRIANLEIVVACQQVPVCAVKPSCHSSSAVGGGREAGCERERQRHPPIGLRRGEAVTTSHAPFPFPV